MKHYIAGFIGGAVVGSAITYFVMKNQQKKQDIEIQQEINKVKEEYSRVETSEKEPEPSEESDDDEEDHGKMYNYAVRSEKMRNAKRERDEERKIFRSVKNQDYLDEMMGGEEDDYDLDDPDDPDSSDPDYIRLDDHIAPAEGPVDHPYSISAADFANTCTHYDKLTLIWYTKDDVLADDENDRLVDFAIIGNDWRNHIGEYEDGVAYIRNEKISCDYEIIKEDLSFFKDAL